MTTLKDLKGREVNIGSTIQFVARYGREVNSTVTGRNGVVVGFTPKGKVKVSFGSDEIVAVQAQRIADCAVLIQLVTDN